MKRILLSVFAAAITAAWVVPASAADVTFSGQYRVRGEYRDNADFNKNVDDIQSVIGQRVRLTANAKATDDTSVKITLQDTRNWGTVTGGPDSGPGLTDTGNTLDLHESYLNVDNIFGAPVSFRAGRQELVYGDERLIGSFGWSNNGRSFDAFKFMYTSDMANVDLFASKIRDNNTTASATGADNDQDFYGVYATTKVIPNNTLDLYALLLRDGNTGAFISNNTTLAGTIDQPQNLYTVGARLKGAAAGLDYTVEVPFQFGEIHTTSSSYDISAYAFAAKVGYTLPTPVKIRVGAEYDYATGDGDASNTDLETFSNLFPTNHDKLGYADQQAWRNVSAWSVNASADVNEKLRLFAAYWMFSLAEEADGWYGAATWNQSATGTLRAASSTNTQDEVGSEIDLVATYKYNNNVTLEAGYSRFFTGDYIDTNVDAVAGSDKEDQDWAYLQITANF